MVKVNIDRQILPKDIKFSLDSLVENFLEQVSLFGAKIINSDSKYMVDDGRYLVDLIFVASHFGEKYCFKGELYLNTDQVYN